jgi:putative hydrolase of HD superfamily
MVFYIAMEKTIRGILAVLDLAERLKFELRHSWLSTGRRESVAEHSWQMALMAVLIHRHLEHPVALERALAMVIVHDLVEAEAGDVPFFESGPRKAAKAGKERAAIEHLRRMLDPDTGREVYDLWCEFETGATGEARFARALDHLEVQLQHNRASLETWEEIELELVYTKMDPHCRHDAFLAALCEAVKAAAEEKMRRGGVDTEAVRRRAAGPGTSPPPPRSP